ncbi:spore coat protein [Rossellomorea vietnamensis]|uniref:spore coat protein n=1 Tax=Rossellomorea vietnamensis TaxID=218284 RepID=UPI003D2AA55F
MNDFQAGNETFVDYHDYRRPIGRVGFGRPGFGYGGFGRPGFGFGFSPFVGGLAGGLLGAALLSPGYGYGYGYGYPPAYGYQPYPYYY